ncbi:MAG: glycosyltransferase [Acidobacteriota bacterium]
MKVTVVVITYNHEKFITQAINSVLMQEVSFDYEVVIVEDCSTDSTRDIIIDFQKARPNRTRLVLSERNMCDNRNYALAIQSASGQYIALLDGDDYWTSPHKLQRQVDFLDSHTECAMCFHTATVFYEDGSNEPWKLTPPGEKEIYSLDDLWGGGFIASCSVMFQREVFDHIPEWFYDIEVGDWALNILCAQHGKIGYLDEVMGAYRKHRGGIWSELSKAQQLEKKLRFYKDINLHLSFVYDEAVRKTIEITGSELVIQIRNHIQARQWKDALQGVAGLVRYYPTGILREAWPYSNPILFRRYPVLYRALDGIRKMKGHSGAAAAPNYEGYHDTATWDMIGGWVWDMNQPNIPLKVAIYDGDNLLAIVPADRFRKDLVDACKGRGFHAFNYPVPAHLKDGKPHLIRVKIAGTNFDLIYTPLEIKSA